MTLGHGSEGSRAGRCGVQRPTLRAPGQAVRPRGGSMSRILVVDDEPDLLGFVRSALEAEGFHVTTATDGTDGLRLALTTKPDLVILDLLMPGLDGQAVLTAL